MKLQFSPYVIALTIFAIAITVTTATPNLFGDCDFGYGLNYASETLTENPPVGLTHITYWLQDYEETGNWGQYDWSTRWLKLCREHSMVPVAFAYLIAGYGKSIGLTDCDMGDNNLCVKGANLVRDTTTWGKILDRYTWYGDQMLVYYPADKPIVFLIEPDILQYTVTGDLKSDYTQEGGGIPDDEMVTKFRQIVARIKAKYPNAKIGIDISPWWNDDLRVWYERFNSDDFDLAYGSGSAATERLNLDNWNNVTWQQVNDWTKGKMILSDIGGGAGGSSDDNGLDSYKNMDNISARYLNGVRGVSGRRDPKEYDYFLNKIVLPNYKTACSIDKSMTVELKGTLKNDKTHQNLADSLATIIAPSSSKLTTLETTTRTVAPIISQCIKSNAILTKTSDTSFVFGATIHKNVADCIKVDKWKTDSVLTTLVNWDSVVIKSSTFQSSIFGIALITLIVLMF